MFKLKNPFLPVFLFVSLLAIWILNSSLKNLAVSNIDSQIKLNDTVIEQKVPLYADTTLYSGYLGNLDIIRNQILNKKRIDSLLKKPLPPYYTLTKEDRKNYILNADQSSTNKLKDTVIFQKQYRIARLKIRFTNYSKDTLRYRSMDCSWLDYYFTNNKSIEFEKEVCYKNESYIRVVAPHHTNLIYIPIIVNRTANIFNRKFRIGMNLQKFIEKMQTHNFDDTDAFKYMLRAETSNMIWSNEVELPSS